MSGHRGAPPVEWSIHCLTIWRKKDRQDRGLNYKDASADARRWLREFGNPYDVIGVDRKGDVGIDWGVYGVPETFVIDREGIIRYKHIGPVDQKVLSEVILPLVSDLKG